MNVEAFSANITPPIGAPMLDTISETSLARYLHAKTIVFDDEETKEALARCESSNGLKKILLRRQKADKVQDRISATT